MTAERIRAAAETVRGKYLLMVDGLGDANWPTPATPDLADPLAALLDRMADSTPAEVEQTGIDPAELELPEYVALLALVEAIEGAR